MFHAKAVEQSLTSRDSRCRKEAGGSKCSSVVGYSDWDQTSRKILLLLSSRSAITAGTATLANFRVFIMDLSVVIERTGVHIGGLGAYA